MTTLLLLNTLIYLLAKVNTHDDLTQTTKSKGHDAQTSQPFKTLTPTAQVINYD